MVRTRTERIWTIWILVRYSSPHCGSDFCHFLSGIQIPTALAKIAQGYLESFINVNFEVFIIHNTVYAIRYIIVIMWIVHKVISYVIIDILIHVLIYIRILFKDFLFDDAEWICQVLTRMNFELVLLKNRKNTVKIWITDMPSNQFMDICPIVDWSVCQVTNWTMD